MITSDKYRCHICGATSGLNHIEDGNKWLCNTCWDIIAHVAKKLLVSVFHEVVVSLKCDAYATLEEQ